MSTIQGLPGWATSTRFDVTGKTDTATDEALAKLSNDHFQAEKQHMLPDMLAERFKLRLHTEPRFATIYGVTTKRTARLMVSVQGDLIKTISSCNMRFLSEGAEPVAEIDAKGCPFHILLANIKELCRYRGLDHTGMSGLYAFHLKCDWTPPVRVDVSKRYPSFRDAIGEQLGPRLKETKEPLACKPWG